MPESGSLLALLHSSDLHIQHAPRGFEPTARFVAWCSASIWSAPDGSGLLTLDASSLQTAPDGSRRSVWMINRMIKQEANRQNQVGGSSVPARRRTSGQADVRPSM